MEGRAESCPPPKGEEVPKIVIEKKVEHYPLSS